MTSETVFDQLIKIQSWPSVGLVFALCIIAGYGWKCLKLSWFPNEAIPPMVFVNGALAQLILGGPPPEGVPWYVWHTRQFIVGLIIGFVAWLSHNLVIKRLEDWIAGQSPTVAKLLGKTNGTPPATPPAP